MSQEPDREQPEEERRGDTPQEPPSWPGTPPHATTGYPYPPEPWAAADPDPAARSETSDRSDEATPEWPAAAPWSAPSGSEAPAAGGSTAYGSTGVGNAAYGTGGYPPGPPGAPPPAAGGGYGPAPGYGAPGYGAPGYGAPGYGPPPGYGTPAGYGSPGSPPAPAGYGPGYPGGIRPVQSPEQSSARTQGIVSLVLNLISVLSCCNVFGIVGAVLAGLALGRVDTDLPQARNLIKWSWVLFGGGLVLIAVGLAIWLGFAVAAGTAGGF